MPLRRLLAVTAFVVFLTCFLTWPQALYLNSRVANHDDSYFSMWRLGWIAHALRTDSTQLYDANIFHPDRRTLAYSDAVILEGGMAAPLLWAGLSRPATYNLVLLAGIVLSGLGMFVLTRHLTDNDRAAAIAAAIFVMVPYRVEHFMHLELQWTCFMPLTFWATHRAMSRASIAPGLLAGILIWLQVLACMYYGVYLGLATATLVLLLAIVYRRVNPRALSGLAVGACIAGVFTYLAARPYIQNAPTLGMRQEGDVAMFSAQGWSYLAAPDENWIWGRWTGKWYSGDELHLFPGLIAIGLAVLALVAKPARMVWVYLALFAVMIELSLGFNGHIYPWLYRNVWALQGMRAAARASILAFCALSVLAAFGYLALERRAPTERARRGFVVACVLLLMLEYGSAPMVLTEVPSGVPEVYQFLRRLPRGVVIELPPATPGTVPGYDVVFMYSSLDHFFPLVNGYSGNVSRRYLATLKRLIGFPDDGSVEHLRELDVRYLVVHENRYGNKAYWELLTKMSRRPEFALLGRHRDIYSEAAVFELRPAAGELAGKAVK